MATRYFTSEEARRIGETIGIDWASAPFELEQFRFGLAVEIAYRAQDPEINVTDDDELIAGKIVWAQLKESPKYYARLASALSHGTIRHTVQVTSFGGCGTTSVCDHLLVAGADLPNTRDCFPFKHMRFPPDPQDVPTGFRVVYLCGDPRNAVLSLHRRWGLEASYGFLHLRHPPEETRPRLATLEAFLEAGVDELQVEDHVEGWLRHEHPGYPVLFVRFESRAEAWPSVREFVGLPAGAPPIELKDRSSDWRSLPEPLRSQIDRLYGDLARRIEDWPPVQIK